MAKEVIITTRSGKQAHIAYTPEEAYEIGLIVVDDWRDGEPDQWVRTEDGWVVQVLNTGLLRRGTKFVRSAWGTFLVTTGSFTTEKRDSRFTFTGRRACREFKMSKRIKAWAAAVVSGQPALKAYLDFFQTKNIGWAEQRVVFLLKQQEVVDFMKAELKPILAKLNIDAEFVVKGYLDMYKEGESDTVKLKCLNELALLTGVKEEGKSNEVPTGFIGFGKVLDEIESGTQQAQLVDPDDETDAGAPTLDELEITNEP